VSLDEYFHVGIVVPELQSAQARLTKLLGTAWGPIVVNDIEVRDGDGNRLMLPNRICYSASSPYLELIEERPGTPWVCNEHSNLHHLGFFSGGLAAESNRLLTAGCPVEIMGGHGDGPPSGWAYHRDPIGVRIEVVDDAMRPAMEQFLFQANGG
jgi:hypothetical protein